MSRAPALASFLALLLAAPLSAEEPGRADWARDPGTGCRFQAPASLASGRVFWTGDCVNGQATGHGMLRRRDAAGAGAAFFGEMREGVPVIGVVEVEGGYEVGRYRAGALGSNSMDFQERTDSFRAAARAARAVAARFAAAGNPGSAAFYEGVAKRLELQED
ncbi:hypothetical protein [Roseomonas populi]|uniref:Uncharacterized protein n=1 Tax=Roseomonas populi TaxID=3121582 RepID=A0ABT1WZC7_9PROT|nr:hypothetical protein [Roseomonas pecuniae]MCR0981210.1 hypothetical protein [Roseomonas pecuniae]